MPARTAIELTVPGDKSISHRALILAALASGRSRIDGLLDAADTRATAAALRALGIDVPRGKWDAVTIQGAGLHGLARPVEEIDCGNSGTTARLLLGALAGCPIQAVLAGDASLMRRPMRRVTGPLAAAGAAFDELGEPDRLPVRVRGRRPLDSLQVANPRASAQVKTAMLLAGLTGGATVAVTEPGLSRDHSERMLRAMGAPVETRRTADGFTVTLDPVERLEPLDLRVPGDFSSAAFFLVLGAMRGPVRVRAVGLNPTRTGALDVLRRMGAGVDVEEGGERAGEPIGAVTVSPGNLRGVEVGRDEIPTLLDEVPVLAVLAARARGKTRFDGIADLRVKESDRIQGMVDNLRRLGADADAGEDWLVVEGSERPLKGEVDSLGDHRIAMAFGVLAAVPGNQIAVRGREHVGISYPTFWQHLERATHEMEA